MAFKHNCRRILSVPGIEYIENLSEDQIRPELIEIFLLAFKS